MASHVFISYASPDQAVALDVCARLEAEGVPCWIAPRDVRAGVPYATSILDGIDRAGMMVLIFSSNANSSRHVPREVERAANHGLAILPLRLEAVKPAGELEYFVSALHWLDALDGEWGRHVPNLVRSIKDILEPGRAPGGAGVAPSAGPMPHRPAPPAPPPGNRAGAAVGSVLNWVKGIPGRARPAPPMAYAAPPPPPPPDPAADEARRAAAEAKLAAAREAERVRAEHEAAVRRAEMARIEAERQRRELERQQQEQARLAEAGRRAQQAAAERAAQARAADLKRRRAENKPRLRELHAAMRDFVDRRQWTAARPFAAEILRIDPTDREALAASALIEAGIRVERSTPPPIPPRHR